MRNEIVHLTLNTGHSSITDLGEIDDVVSESLGLIEGEYVPMPEWTPWLAVIQMPGIATVTGQDLAWMGDFEKCMAHALLREVEHGRIQ